MVPSSLQIAGEDDATWQDTEDQCPTLIPDNGSDSPYEPSLPDEGAGKDKQCVVLHEATSPRASDYHSDPDENDDSDDDSDDD